MRLLIAAALCLLAFVPTVSADHWNWDSTDGIYVGDSGCDYLQAACIADYGCTGGAPSQVVDLVLYCALRLESESEDIAAWVPYFGWMWVEWGAAEAENTPGLAHDEAQPALDRDVNPVLCDTVWSFFCTNPLTVPEHVPVADPLTDYPLS